MSNNSFDSYIRGLFQKGGAPLVVYTLDKNINTQNVGISKDQVDALKGHIMGKYIERIWRDYSARKRKESLHFVNNTPVLVGQNYSFLDRAIIMTYHKYHQQFSQGESPADAMTVTKKCLFDLIENSHDHFTRDVDSQGKSSRWYANEYLDSMKNFSPENWKRDIYRQMLCDVSLEYKHDSVSRDITTVQNIKKDDDKGKENFISKVKAFFPKNVEKLKYIIESGKAKSAKHVSGNISGMYYCQDMGNVRKNQEDALLIMQHPKVKDLRLAIVSDGMGGYESGELASHMVVEEFKKWFESVEIPSTGFVNDNLKAEINRKIAEISMRVHNEYNKAGATLTGAIIGKDKALVMNVGDSRTYAVKGGELRQITVDHSRAHMDYIAIFKKAYPNMTEDEMRFYMHSNEISRYIGSDNPYNSQADFFEVDSSRYDQLVLCSDGMSDCLGYKDIATCVKQSNVKDMAQMLVNGAVTTLSINTRNAELFKQKIAPGKDNTTVVVVDNNKKSNNLER